MRALQVVPDFEISHAPFLIGSILLKHKVAWGNYLFSGRVYYEDCL
jgi:hypothetical protein